MYLMFEEFNLLSLSVEDCMKLQSRGYAVAFNDGAGKVELSIDKKE